MVYTDATLILPRMKRVAKVQPKKPPTKMERKGRNSSLQESILYS
jgi:hypothetical protein